MAGLIRVVVVNDPDLEVARAELVDGAIRYGGDAEIIHSIIQRQAKARGVTEAEAFASVAESGWSNGYLMVALDELPGG